MSSVSLTYNPKPLFFDTKAAYEGALTSFFQEAIIDATVKFLNRRSKETEDLAYSIVTLWPDAPPSIYNTAKKIAPFAPEILQSLVPPINNPENFSHFSITNATSEPSSSSTKRKIENETNNKNWTDEEDLKLLKLIKKYQGIFSPWNNISIEMFPRTKAACRLHYQKFILPRLTEDEREEYKFTYAKLNETNRGWTDKERDKLLTLLEEFQHNQELWSIVAKQLGRTEEAAYECYKTILPILPIEDQTRYQSYCSHPSAKKRKLNEDQALKTAPEQDLGENLARQLFLDVWGLYKSVKTPKFIDFITKKTLRILDTKDPLFPHPPIKIIVAKSILATWSDAPWVIKKAAQTTLK